MILLFLKRRNCHLLKKFSELLKQRGSLDDWLGSHSRGLHCHEGKILVHIDDIHISLINEMGIGIGMGMGMAMAMGMGMAMGYTIECSLIGC